MGIDLGALFRSAAQGGAGYLAGRQARKEQETAAERQARLDLIAQQVAEANLERLRQDAVDRAQRRTREEEDRDRAETERTRGEALQYERAQSFADLYPEAVPQGLHPEIAIERGERAQAEAAGERGFERTMDLTRARTAASQPGKDALEFQRQFQREQALVDDYDRTVRPWLVPFNALTRAQRNVPEARQGDTAAQIQMLYAFINSLDNSVVREGEANMFARAAPLLERAKQQVNKLALGRGAVMPPQQVDEVARILDQVQATFADRFDAFRAQYGRRAERWGIDPESFMDIPETFGGKREPEEEPEGMPSVGAVLQAAERALAAGEDPAEVDAAVQARTGKTLAELRGEAR